MFVYIAVWLHLCVIAGFLLCHTDRKISVVRLLCWSIRILGVGCLKLHAVFPAGTSTPSFGQSAAGGPIPFGSPGTQLQGFNAVQFGEASVGMCG